METELENEGVSSPIFLGEVTVVIKQLHSGKASRIDEISPEILKALGVEGLSWLTYLLNIALGSGSVPKEWQTGVVVPLFEKGDQSVCANYRGITLLSLPGKVYSKVLERKVWPIVELGLKKNNADSVLVMEHQTSFLLWQGSWRGPGSTIFQSTSVL